MRTVLVTHGEPETAALWSWLKTRGASVALVELPRGKSLEAYAERRRKERRPERILILEEAAEELEVLRRWFRDLPPIELRAGGARLIEERVATHASGGDVLERALRRIHPTARRPRTHGKRGRRPGINPFAGVGFEVCLELLLDPKARWTERSLAERIERVPSAVHRVLVELEERGHLRRARGAIRLLADLPLRDDLAAKWSERVASRPEAVRLLAPPIPDVASAVFRVARESGKRCLLAGAQAVRGPERFVGAPLTIYGESGLAEGMVGAGFQTASFRGDVEVWRPPEDAVFRYPRQVGDFPATNRVVTWLDLVLAATDRHRAAAEAVWVEAA